MKPQLTITPDPEAFVSGFCLEVTHTDGLTVVSHSPFDVVEGDEAIFDFPTARRAARAIEAADDVAKVVIRPMADVATDPNHAPEGR